MKSSSRHNELMKLAKKKLDERNSKRDEQHRYILDYFKERNITTEQVEHLVTLSTDELIQEVFAEKVTVADCVAASSYVALLTGKHLESNAEELFIEAIEAGIQCDNRLLRGPQTPPEDIITPPPCITSASVPDEDLKNLLFGVPVSIKDQIDIKGYDSTCGLAKNVFKPSDDDAVVVKLLKEQGAIPIARGNTPTLLMMPETHNTVYGCTMNAYNPTKAAGGSTGGDGVLVSTRAVKIAIGTDIGGSLRIPSHYSGLYTIKPTPSRISLKGISSPNAAPQQQIATAVGPMSNTTDGIIRVMRSWLLPRMRELDPYAIPTKWNHELFLGTNSISKLAEQQVVQSTVETKAPIPNLGKKLRIGYFVYDGYVDAPPVAYRAINMAKHTLEQLGHELVEFNPPNVAEAVNLYLTLLGADGSMKSFEDGLGGEKMASMYLKLKFSASLPACVRPLLAQVMSLFGEGRTADVVKSARAKTTYEYWHDIADLLNYKQRFLDEWQKLNLDIVICPGAFTPAVSHLSSKDFLPLFVSCFLWNILEYPVGAAPITFVRQGEDDLLKDAKCKDSFTRAAHAGMQGSTGLPFGIQVASLPFCDELVLRVLTQLESGLEACCPQDDTELHVPQRFFPPTARTFFKVPDLDDDETEQVDGDDTDQVG